MKKSNINVLHSGAVELITSHGSIVANLKHCKAKDGKNVEFYAHYIDFDVNDDKITDFELNTSKLELVKFYVENFYNNVLFRSSTKNPTKLYKYVDNVKGKEFILVPRLTIIN